jgi:uncharacterized membrane protein HdeD (DUF308 family)
VPVRVEMNEAAATEFAEVARAWWVLVLLGLLGVIAGIIVLAVPSISLATLAVLTGIFFLIDGIVEVTSALIDAEENRALIAIFGVITAIAGVILIRHPTHALTAIALLVGLWLLVAGLLRLIRTFSQLGARGPSFALAALEMLAGIVIVSSPGIGITTLALLIGIAFIIRGFMLAAAGWALRSLGRAVSPGAAGPGPGAASPGPGGA